MTVFVSDVCTCVSVTKVHLLIFPPTAASASVVSAVSLRVICPRQHETTAPRPLRPHSLTDVPVCMPVVTESHLCRPNTHRLQHGGQSQFAVHTLLYNCVDLFLGSRQEKLGADITVEPLKANADNLSPAEDPSGGDLNPRRRGERGKTIYRLLWQQAGVIVQELCESQGGRPGLSVLTTEPCGFRGRKAILNRANALVSDCP